MTGLTVVFLMAVSACASSSVEPTATPANSTPATSNEQTSFTCAEWDMKSTPDVQVQAALSAAKLPTTVELGEVITERNSDDPSMLNVLAYVCGAGVSGPALKDVATTLAQSLKASPIGERIAQMRVSNVADRSDPRMRVRCNDFQLYTWAATVDPAVARTNWQ